MSTNSVRLGFAVLMLALLWVVVYWMTPAPRADNPSAPEITFGDSPEADLIDHHDPAESSADLVETAAGPTLADVDPQSPITTPGESFPVVPPAYTLYRIKFGDSLQSIASRKYGSTQYWQSIAKMNPDVDPSKLKSGQLIKLPVDPENIQGRPAAEIEAADAAPGPGVTEYIVNNGDTLSGIAKALYGRASLWTVIRDANRGQINRDGTNIRPGMVLKIPPPPDAAR